MCKVTLRGFYEYEERKVFYIETLFRGNDFNRVEAQARAFAEAIHGAAEEMEREWDCDGFFITVSSEPSDVDFNVMSYEIQAGREIVTWYGEECI
jgi:hypothetical protein